MAIWFCRPALLHWEVELTPSLRYKNTLLNEDNAKNGGLEEIGYILDGDAIVVINTENVKESLYESFSNSRWENGRALGFTLNDDYKAIEKDNEFDVFVNEKFVAKFFKDRRFS